MAKKAKAETHSFQTEVQQLLHLMIHSLYSHKEIFLRELIANSSDACDRLRFSSVQDASLMEDGEELAITITVDKDAHTLTIVDNGIGMNHDEVIDNLGMIASSGTQQFVESLSGDEAKDATMIGQFGVGFYSVFMVADKVTVESRRAGEPADSAIIWTSNGEGEYQLESTKRDNRGTSITLHLREDENEFLETFRLRSIIEKYSDHITLPIRMKMDEEKDELEQINKGAALWARAKSDISEEEYNNFYTTLSYDPEPPMSVLHNHVEGKLEYTSLLYIPSKAPYDIWDREHRKGLKLYVRRIFIMDDAEHLMPPYLRFVKGLVDSADLPLNVSREFLQKNRAIDTIRSALVKKVLGELKKTADKKPEKYANFWKEFGKIIKEGVVDDHENKEKVAELLRFASTHYDEDTQNVSLDDYISRMQDDQKEIYYVTADTWKAAATSPHLEIFRKKGIEVLLLSDPIDEWVVNHLIEYKKKSLKSVAKGGLELDDSETKKEKKATEKKLKKLIEGIATALGDRVKEVRISTRLTDSPSCLVADENDIGANMERLMKSMGQEIPGSAPIMEINPEHDLISYMDEHQDELEDWSQVLYDQALLSEGGKLEAPADYVRRINKLLTSKLAS
ncbi:chaperone protein HtpG [bacterium BMS3Bbin11]|nr:chaperone protein HtpG [bacterium BMS3Abin11]GBE45282.1 chaperone protein HtpG [bacterium BMS3Bbin11]HDH17040.1 molecular chaperone HtpG [Gammaproteobacteria bacterium]HDZ79363.1 molecular chaperone HtpG [Gammaproteobacteria bacterium]